MASNMFGGLHQPFGNGQRDSASPFFKDAAVMTLENPRSHPPRPQGCWTPELDKHYAGMSTHEIAADLRAHPASVRRWRNGQMKIDWDRVGVMMLATKLPITAFFPDTGPIMERELPPMAENTEKKPHPGFAVSTRQDTSLHLSDFQPRIPSLSTSEHVDLEPVAASVVSGDIGVEIADTTRFSTEEVIIASEVVATPDQTPATLLDAVAYEDTAAALVEHLAIESTHDLTVATQTVEVIPASFENEQPAIVEATTEPEKITLLDSPGMEEVSAQVVVEATVLDTAPSEIDTKTSDAESVQDAVSADSWDDSLAAMLDTSQDFAKPVTTMPAHEIASDIAVEQTLISETSPMTDKLVKDVSVETMPTAEEAPEPVIALSAFNPAPSSESAPDLAPANDVPDVGKPESAPVETRVPRSSAKPEQTLAEMLDAFSAQQSEELKAPPAAPPRMTSAKTFSALMSAKSSAARSCRWPMWGDMEKTPKSPIFCEAALAYPNNHACSPYCMTHLRAARQTKRAA